MGKYYQVCDKCCCKIGVEINSEIESRCHRKFCDVCGNSSGDDLSLIPKHKIDELFIRETNDTMKKINCEYCKKSSSNTGKFCHEHECPENGFSSFEPIDKPFIPEYFSGLNAHEAKNITGKQVELSNLRSHWDPCFLGEVRGVGWAPFVSTQYDEYYYLRTTPETFKPKTAPILPALKESWLMWEIIAMTGLSKKDVYEFLGGDSSRGEYCFLCDYTGYNGQGVGNPACKKCIDWTGNKHTECFSSDYNVYMAWGRNPTPEKAQVVADFLHKKYIELSKEE